MDVCRKHGISGMPLEDEIAGMTVSDARKLQALEEKDNG